MIAENPSTKVGESEGLSPAASKDRYSDSRSTLVPFDSRHGSYRQSSIVIDRSDSSLGMVNLASSARTAFSTVGPMAIVRSWPFVISVSIARAGCPAIRDRSGIGKSWTTRKRLRTGVRKHRRASSQLSKGGPLSRRFRDLPSFSTSTNL